MRLKIKLINCIKTIQMNEDIIVPLRNQQNQYQKHQQIVNSKDIIYQNRIFHIKKKYSVSLQDYNITNQHQQKLKQKSSFTNRIKSKPSEVFSKYLDVIQQNKSLLRRGACDMPLNSPISSSITKKQQKRYKKSQELIKISKDNINSQKTDIKQKKTKNLQIISQNNRHKLPHKLIKRYNNYSQLNLQYNKSQKNAFIDRNYTTRSNYFQNAIKNKNTMNRKLALEMIYYSMLGQWTKQSLFI